MTGLINQNETQALSDSIGASEPSIVSKSVLFAKNDSGNYVPVRVNDNEQLKVVLDGKVCTNNTTTTPLLAGAVYTGIAGETLDYALIFVTVYSDVESATDGLQLEFSSDGTTWRSGNADSFTIPAGTEKTFSFQPLRRYFRVKYTNGGSDQTIFDLETIFKKTNSKPSSHRIQDAISDQDDAELVKSILTGKTAGGNFINFGATNGGNFKVSLEEFESGVSTNSNTQLKVTLYDSSGNEVAASGKLSTETTIVGNQNEDRYVWVAPSNALKTQIDVRLVGTNFDGTNKDPNFWTETVVGSGSVTQAGGEIELDTGTTADSSATYDSVRRARFIVGSALKWQAVLKFVTEGTANNVRRAGAYDDDNGFFFELDGTTFSVGFRKGGVDTTISSGSFNGNGGATYSLDQAYHKFVIEWAPKGVFFYIDNTLIHKDGQGHRSNFLSLPIRIENVNSGGSTSDVAFDCLATAILRLGELQTNGTYKYIGTNTTTVCKYGPGVLQKIVNLDNAGSVTVYDNTAASGNQIAVIDTAKALGTLSFDAPFSTGLTIVSASGAKITVIYE